MKYRDIMILTPKQILTDSKGSIYEFIEFVNPKDHFTDFDENYKWYYQYFITKDNKKYYDIYHQYDFKIGDQHSFLLKVKRVYGIKRNKIKPVVMILRSEEFYFLERQHIESELKDAEKVVNTLNEILKYPLP